MNNLGRKTKALKEGDPKLSGEHIREGLGAVIAVKVGVGVLGGEGECVCGGGSGRGVWGGGVSPVAIFQLGNHLRMCLRR